MNIRGATIIEWALLAAIFVLAGAASLKSLHEDLMCQQDHLNTWFVAGMDACDTLEWITPAVITNHLTTGGSIPTSSPVRVRARNAESYRYNLQTIPPHGSTALNLGQGLNATLSLDGRSIDISGTVNWTGQYQITFEAVGQGGSPTQSRTFTLQGR